MRLVCMCVYVRLCLSMPLCIYTYIYGYAYFTVLDPFCRRMRIRCRHITESFKSWTLLRFNDIIFLGAKMEWKYQKYIDLVLSSKCFSSYALAQLRYSVHSKHASHTVYLRRSQPNCIHLFKIKHFFPTSTPFFARGFHCLFFASKEKNGICNKFSLR